MKPLAANYINVGDGHQLYVSQWGNPKGSPVLFLHGGPGLGTTDRDHRFFDLTKTKLIIFDQRGCGQSTPTASLAHNTTQHLIQDINQLLDHFAIEKVILFGGSWGSTLALFYAIEHPERVQALVLRGIFTGDLAARQHFEQGGTAAFFPEAWERFQKLVPLDKREDVSGYYFRQILEGDEVTRRTYAYELMYYGLSLSQIGMTNERADEIMQHADYVTESLILAHYSVNGFFVPDQFIWQNLSGIAHLPTYIVHGRYDMICLAQSAYRLHQQLPYSKLYMVNAGHAAGESAIEECLRETMHDLCVF